MSIPILFNSRLFIGAQDLTGVNNKLEFEESFDVKEVTNFGSEGAKEVIAGLRTSTLSAEGQLVHGGDSDPIASWFAQQSVSEAYSVCPDGAAVGALSHLTMMVRSNAKWFGQVGDVYPWSLNAAGDWPVASGAVLYPPGSPITGDADGTAVQLPDFPSGVPAGKRLYAAVHLLSIAGTNTPELTVTIESDTVQAFSGSPETRLTFGPYMTTGAEAKRTAIGAHADTWYRVGLVTDDNGGTGMSFLALVTLGIN